MHRGIYTGISGIMATEKAAAWHLAGMAGPPLALEEQEGELPSVPKSTGLLLTCKSSETQF